MIGKLLGGRYEILEKIDSGGMAYVYKALCKKTENIVAVKVLKEKFANSAEYVNRFKKEAQAAFALEHPHVVHVTDVGFDHGAYYLVMEYIEGPSLKMLIEQGGGISEKKAIDYAIQICSALSAAHKKGIVHRDVKPQNILIDADGMVKVTDFGIAKSITGGDETDNQVIGSVYYISPEQAKGDRVDGRSDIYSLGIVLYEMLTGTLPYEGEKTVSVALKHINEQMTPPERRNERISKSANNIVMRAASKMKRARYRSMQEMKMDLMRALVDKDGEFVRVAVPQPAAIKPANARKHRIWKIAVLVVLTCVLTVVIVLGTGALHTAGQEAVVLPDLAEMTDIEAAEELRRLGVEFEISRVVSHVVDEGFVIGQMPEAGAVAPQEGVVTLTVSDGPDDPVMPEVLGLSEVEAITEIEEIGLALTDTVYEESADVEPGYVLVQVPEPGETVLEGDMITLVVSALPAENTAAMPSAVGLPLEEAVGQLFDTGFTNIFVYQESSGEDFGTVTAQSPEQGAQEAFDDEVFLWISRYPKLDFECHFFEMIDVPEIESKVRVVVEEMIGSTIVNFVLEEKTVEPGKRLINLDRDIISGGTKTIKIYLNNVQQYVYEVESTERSGIGEREDS